MALTSQNSPILAELSLASQTALKPADKTALARRLVDPLLALLRSEQIQPSPGEKKTFRGLEATLRNIRHESLPEFLGRDLMGVAEEYLYSVTFQPLALSILKTLKDSSLPQATAAASLLATFEGTAGSLGQHLTHQLRRLTQTETLIPMAAAIALAGMAGRLTRVALSSVWQQSGRMAGRTLLSHSVSGAGAILAESAFFPVGHQMGFALVGGEIDFQNFRQEFIHGLQFMTTLGATGLVARRGLQWLHQMDRLGRVKRFHHTARWTQPMLPLMAEYAGVVGFNYQSGNLWSYTLLHSAKTLVDLRMARSLNETLLPGLAHSYRLLDLKAYHSLQEAIAGCSRKLAQTFPSATVPSRTLATQGIGGTLGESPWKPSLSQQLQLDRALASKEDGNKGGKVLQFPSLGKKRRPEPGETTQGPEEGRGLAEEPARDPAPKPVSHLAAAAAKRKIIESVRAMGLHDPHSKITPEDRGLGKNIAKMLEDFPWTNVAMTRRLDRLAERVQQAHQETEYLEGTLEVAFCECLNALLDPERPAEAEEAITTFEVLIASQEKPSAEPPEAARPKPKVRDLNPELSKGRIQAQVKALGLDQPQPTELQLDAFRMEILRMIDEFPWENQIRVQCLERMLGDFARGLKESGLEKGGPAAQAFMEAMDRTFWQALSDLEKDVTPPKEVAGQFREEMSKIIEVTTKPQ